MDTVSLVLLALMTGALVLLVAPRVFAFNRGRILRNVALWLLIFLGLALFYRHFGPGSANPVVPMPSAMKAMEKARRGADGPVVPAAPEDKGYGPGDKSGEGSDSIREQMPSVVMPPKD